jgi:hypothetical protein
VRASASASFKTFISPQPGCGPESEFVGPFATYIYFNKRLIYFSQKPKIEDFVTGRHSFIVVCLTNTHTLLTLNIAALKKTLGLDELALPSQIPTGSLTE